MEAPLVNGVYSKETGRTYWIHQCLVDANQAILCPFSRTILSDLAPNTDFDRLFKAAFPKAYKAACKIYQKSLKEYDKRLKKNASKQARQAHLDAQPFSF
jgi:histone H3/H4